MSPAEAAEEVMRRRFGRNTLVEFAQAIDVPGKPYSDDPNEWIFKPVETVVAAHHVLLMDTLDRVFNREIHNLMVFMPPGSAKSTYASVVYPAYAMGKRPGSRFILSSYASAIAWKQSRRTRQIAKSDKFRPLFEASLTAGNQSVEEWSMDNGSEYMASGLTSGVTGNRATDIIVDDPVSGREDAESLTIRKKTREAYEDDLMTRLVPGGAQIIIQTRWHEDDLSGGILPIGWDGESGLMRGRDGLDWQVLCLPAICDRVDDPLGRAIGDPLWPEWFTGDHFERFRGRPRTWSALFQQKPRPSEGSEFLLAWIRRYTSAPRTLNKIILADPASGKRKKDGTIDTQRDFTCFWVIGLGADKNAYIVDCIRDRLNLSQRVEAVMDLHRKHKPLQVRYETYGLQSDIEAIEMAQEREQYRFKITPVGGSTSKEDRIRRLVPWFENGLIYAPGMLLYTDTTGKQHDLMKQFLEQEYAAFPVSRHDDMFDSLSRLAEPTLKLPYPQEARNESVEDFQSIDNEMAY